MKPKTLVLMVVAVTCGLGASYMTSRLLADRGPTEDKTPVLVAKRQIDNGSPIKVPQDLFEHKLYVKGEEPKDAIVDLEALKGRIVKRTLRPGDFVRPEDLLDSKDPQATFAANLPEGYLAVGLRVNLESIAGGFAALPLSRVDIIQTVRRGDDKTSYAKFILENVLVLAADAKTTRDENGNAMPASIITFALSPADVLKLNLSKEVGTLSLALRKFNNNKHNPIQMVTAEEVRNGHIDEKGEHSLATEDMGATPQGIAQLPPQAPPLNANDAKPAPEVAKEVPVEPVHNKHILLIIEGDKSRQVPFLLDKQGRSVSPEVTRTELSARPPQVQAPAPEEKED